MARYAEKEAPLLERIIMQEGLERTKAEDWARDEITRLREELAAVTERMSRLDFERTAAELERDALRAENARLREALEPFSALFLYPDDLGVEYAEDIRSDPDWDDVANGVQSENVFVLRRDIRRARAAIREGGKE